MSFGAQQAHFFLEPLKGKTTTFLVESRQANLSFAKCIILLIAMTESGCTILDVDAFYSSNSKEILSALPLNAAKSTLIYVLGLGSSIEAELPRLFMVESEVFVVDSLNTLYHLFSSSGANSKSRKFAFVMASFSYLARTSGKAVFLTMYKRENTMKTGGSRSISDLSDTIVSVEAAGSELLLKCERGTAWPGGRVSLSVT